MASQTLCTAALLSAAAWAQTTTPVAPSAPADDSAQIEQAQQDWAQAQQAMAQAQTQQVRVQARARQALVQAQIQQALAQVQEQVLAQVQAEQAQVQAKAEAAQAKAQAVQARSAVRTMPAPGTYLGVGVEDVDANRAGALKLKEPRGAEVTMVSQDSPAAKAGIRVGDVILEYNSQPVEGTAELQRLVHETPAGRQVKIGLWRNGAPVTITTTIEEHALALHNDFWPFGPGFPNLPPMPAIDIPRIVTTYENSGLGVDCQMLAPNSQFADFLGVKDGLLVLSVNRNSAAEKAGIKAGDVIVKAGDAHIANHRDLSAALRANRGKAMPLTVMRNKRETVLTVTLDDNGRQEHY